MSATTRQAIPTPFEVTEAMFLWAQQLRPQPLTPDLVQQQTEQFIDYHLARGSRFLDWKAAWRTWMRNVSSWHAKDIRGRS